MPKDYFKFKQFTVRQGQTAMKVCTDACILGAWVRVLPQDSILDIGTGTGLLALMLAQKEATTTIDAVEIEPNAHAQALENVRHSPFLSQIFVHLSSVQTWRPSHQYSLIVSNPPFFQNHLRSTDSQRNQALHTDTLSFADLLSAVLRLLLPKGRFVILLPEYESTVFEKLALGAGLYPHKKLIVKQKAEGTVFRICTEYGFGSQDFSVGSLCIHKGSNEYSTDFQRLLKEYYLIF